MGDVASSMGSLGMWVVYATDFRVFSTCCSSPCGFSDQLSQQGSMRSLDRGRSTRVFATFCERADWRTERGPDAAPKGSESHCGFLCLGDNQFGSFVMAGPQ